MPPKALAELLTELQTMGLRWSSETQGGLSRRGGAGPSDHKAVQIGGHTVMVPIYTHGAAQSPFEVRTTSAEAGPLLHRNGVALSRISFPPTPRFYRRTTAEGVPYWKIATLHASDVLATTVLQHCIRYGRRETACQFCAVEQSLASGATIAEKTPSQLAEVTQAAVELDGVRHAVLTTGTPAAKDRGAAVLARCAEAIRAATALPIQAQCEPPADFVWFSRLRSAGVDSLGLHLEACTEAVRRRIMPGKAKVPVSYYMEAFSAAVSIFGRGQVTTYLLAGLGDSHSDIVSMCERVAALGVYPFVVPFVPIAGTPLAHHRTPDAPAMDALLSDVSRVIARYGLRSGEIKAGCGRCGACSTLQVRESPAEATCHA